VETETTENEMKAFISSVLGTNPERETGFLQGKEIKGPDAVVLITKRKSV
jgi:hypothetical protein